MSKKVKLLEEFKRVKSSIPYIEKVLEALILEDSSKLKLRKIDFYRRFYGLGEDEPQRVADISQAFGKNTQMVSSDVQFIERRIVYRATMQSIGITADDVKDFHQTMRNIKPSYLQKAL